MSIQQPLLHKLWVRKQLVDMKYVVNEFLVMEDEPNIGEEEVTML